MRTNPYGWCCFNLREKTPAEKKADAKNELRLAVLNLEMAQKNFNEALKRVMDLED